MTVLKVLAFLTVVGLVIGFWVQGDQIARLQYYQEKTTEEMQFDSSSTYSGTTATITANDITENGFITYTNAAAGTFSFESAATLYNRLKAHPGTKIEFTIYNASASGLTLGTAATTPVIGTGLTTNMAISGSGSSSNYNIAAGGLVHFTLIFTSSTTAVLYA